MLGAGTKFLRKRDFFSSNLYTLCRCNKNKKKIKKICLHTNVLSHIYEVLTTLIFSFLCLYVFVSILQIPFKPSLLGMLTVFWYLRKNKYQEKNSHDYYYGHIEAFISVSFNVRLEKKNGKAVKQEPWTVQPVRRSDTPFNHEVMLLFQSTLCLFWWWWASSQHPDVSGNLSSLMLLAMCLSLQVSGRGQWQYDVPCWQRGGPLLCVPGWCLGLPASGIQVLSKTTDIT